MIKYLILVFLWIGYFAIHSLLASDIIKKRVSFIGKYYRLLYNILAVVGLFAILIYSAIIPAEWFYNKTTFRKFIGLMFATYGLFIIKRAFKSYNLKDFIGVEQLSNNYKNEKFKKDGILAYVRHPLYLGTILIILGFFIFSPSIANLISAIINICYLFVGIWLEEQKLTTMYGDDYKRYKKETPMLIPKKIKIF